MLLRAHAQQGHWSEWITLVLPVWARAQQDASQSGISLPLLYPCEPVLSRVHLNQVWIFFCSDRSCLFFLYTVFSCRLPLATSGISSEAQMNLVFRMILCSLTGIWILFVLSSLLSVFRINLYLVSHNPSLGAHALPGISSQRHHVLSHLFSIVFVGQPHGFMFSAYAHISLRQKSCQNDLMSVCYACLRFIRSYAYLKIVWLMICLRMAIHFSYIFCLGTSLGFRV